MSFKEWINFYLAALPVSLLMLGLPVSLLIPNLVLKLICFTLCLFGVPIMRIGLTHLTLEDLQNTNESFIFLWTHWDFKLIKLRFIKFAITTATVLVTAFFCSLIVGICIMLGGIVTTSSLQLLSSDGNITSQSVISLNPSIILMIVIIFSIFITIFVLHTFDDYLVIETQAWQLTGKQSFNHLFNQLVNHQHRLEFSHLSIWWFGMALATIATGGIGIVVTYPTYLYIKYKTYEQLTYKAQVQYNDDKHRFEFTWL